MRKTVVKLQLVYKKRIKVSNVSFVYGNLHLQSIWFGILFKKLHLIDVVWLFQLIVVNWCQGEDDCYMMINDDNDNSGSNGGGGGYGDYNDIDDDSVDDERWW